MDSYNISSSVFCKLSVIFLCNFWSVRDRDHCLFIYFIFGQLISKMAGAITCLLARSFCQEKRWKIFLWFLRIFVPRMITSIVGRLSKWFAYVFFVSGDRGNFPKYSRCYLSTINWFIFETIGLRLHSKSSLIFGAFVSVREFSWMHVMFVKINEISGNFFRRVFQDARSKYF